MPTSVPPSSRRGAAYSTPPSPASSDDEGAGKSSSFSLISPSFHRSFHRARQEEEATSASRGSGIPQRIKQHSADHFKDTKRKNRLIVEENLSPWEEWFLSKEKELRARLQERAMKEVNQEKEKRREKQEREIKKKLAEEKHKEWVQKKNEEVKREKRERELKLSKEMAEKAAKELERAQSKEKSREMYQEWLKKKKMEEGQKKKEEKEKEKQREAELQEKKEKSEQMFKEWLQNSKTKPRQASAGCASADGKDTGYPEGSTYPAPAFYNPVPWKPVHVPPPKEEKYVSMKKNKRPKSSHTYRPSMPFHKSKSSLYIGSLCRIQR
ncbi:coiled-coil domain-containing protein 34 isoform X1 [Podarcis raffonei]|uniref:coiled-coil domain-containing protein 34 isoform X1 n=1 Tax=Podarcis raffonei TaxID=65483 RepID=UPI0023295664|nr:coiled-coil domain-containing protein 34 isoform X1 [Podarcis raffonei]XP_053245505.1 coiled-coil domain-containing protein 34 isoform X1 [Podarcis raffonei]XP_053245514.1 coiled-coil domain-containing protein 34 isoform X1 [Podarcis raffonei]